MIMCAKKQNNAKKACSFPGCGRPRYGKQDICHTHYEQRRSGRPLTVIGSYRPTRKPKRKCKFRQCTRHAVAKGLCSAHWNQQRIGIPLRKIRPRRLSQRCSICRKQVAGFIWCAKHYQRFQKHGDPNFVASRHRPTGTTVTQKGCCDLVKLPSHPRANRRGWVRKPIVDAESCGELLDGSERIFVCENGQMLISRGHLRIVACIICGKSLVRSRSELSRTNNSYCKQCYLNSLVSPT